jgi:hypothetical protein
MPECGNSWQQFFACPVSVRRWELSRFCRDAPQSTGAQRVGSEFPGALFADNLASSPKGTAGSLNNLDPLGRRLAG